MKATSVPAIELKSALTPSPNFEGNDTRKSISLKCDVRIDKNSNIDVEEDSSAIASDMKNTLNQTLFNKIGLPVSGLLPPGTVKAAAKATPVINVATTMLKFTVSFIHFSPSTRRFSCSFVNNSHGVRLLEFFIFR